jgi:Ca-activated chloride channel family protein
MIHDESNPPNPDLHPPLPTFTWRRPALLVSGLSLLTLGAFLNADRWSFAAEEEEVLVEVAEQEARPEGGMGRAGSKSKAGMYAMRGPAASHQAGILGVMQQPSGHFLASPYGGAFAAGDGDQDIWGELTGTEVGDAYGVAGLGLIGTGTGGGGLGEGARGEPIEFTAARTFVTTDDDATSTFSIDVDTASYSLARRSLLEWNQLPSPASVRTEELINYFDYDYPRPASDVPFSVTTEVGPSPWSPDRQLVHIGLRGAMPATVPPRNLVYLVDVSGSMADSTKLPLVKHGLAALTEQLDDMDRLSIVVYAGGAGVVLEPTSGGDHAAILAAIDQLQTGGGTDGGAGIELAYTLAERSFIEGGINRVMLATDGDFNLGVSSHDALIELIEAKRESGVFLSVLGFGVVGADATMEQIADHGNGNYAMIDSKVEARKVLVDEAGATLQTIAKDVKLQVEFDEDQVASHRLIGYENRRLAHRDFADDSKDAGEIGAGHSVTAIYEIVPTHEFDSASDMPIMPIMTLDLRYKQPDGGRSELVRVPIVDRSSPLADTSDDFRFAAAVAAFGEALHHVDGSPSYADILSLAAGALGRDHDCYRHQFMAMVRRAATLSGETIARPDTQCIPVAKPSSSRPVALALRAIAHPTLHPAPVAEAEQDWMAFVLEVLRLLPPLLALPLFVMAARRPKRSRRV